MTSDAKIGLLLSLIFIFIIAFVINGLPNFLRGENNNKLTQDYLNKMRSQDADITSGAREIVASIRNIEPVKKTEVTESRRSELGRIRSIRPLPQVKIPLPVNNTEGLKTAALPKPVQIPARKTETVRPVKPERTRVLQARADIKDESRDNAESMKVKTIPLASAVQTGRYRVYIVKDGDSLWKIANEQLSNPSRYLEIAKLNKDILEDEDQLTVGMRIKLPNR